MTLAAGQTLTHYEILGPLGAGGMGEVYCAKDTRLEREVAIKVLPDELADDEERLRRFEREAKTLASLNHANLAHVYGIDQFEGTCFIAMELVAGEDLAARLARGALPVGEAVEVCRQIAEGLEAAHEAGVVHRDLKPANLRITPGGVVKILDFGLAKPIHPRSGREGASAAESDSFLLTEEGLVLGTPTYMSPEQARGRPVDKRTDVWAFGCVLYECLTGKRVFGGESLTDVLAAIVEREPDWSALPGATPASARRLLRRCLDKDSRTRLRDVGEARIALSSTDEGAPAIEGRRWTLAAGVLVLGILLGFSLSTLLERGEPEAAEAPHPARTFEIPAAGIAVEGFGSAISPDGKHVAYVGEGRIRIHSLESARTRDLDGTEGAGLLAWSPDAQEIAYHAGSSLWRIPREGGAPRKICDLSTSWARGAGLAWGAGDRIAFSPGYEGLHEVSANGGEVRSLLVPENSIFEHFHVPSFLPDGKGLVYARHGPEGTDSLEVLAGSERKAILRLPGSHVDEPCWSPTGHVLFLREYEGTGIWALPFSLERMEATGEPFLVVPGSSRPTMSSEGALLHFVTGAQHGNTLCWVDEEGAVEAFGEEQDAERRHRMIHYPSLSPDGRHVAAVVVERGSMQISVYDLRRGTWTRLTHDGRPKQRPRWASGGDIVYDVSAATGAHQDVWRVSMDGTAEPEVLAEHASVPDVSRDGRWLVFFREEVLLALDLEQGGEPFAVMEDRGWWPALSPDGNWIVYQSDASGRQEVYLRPFRSGVGRWQVSSAGGRYPYWSPEGDRLFYVEGQGPRADIQTSRLFSVPVQLGPEPSLGVPEPLLELRDFYPTDFDPATRRFLAVVREKEHNEVPFPLRVTLDWMPAGHGR